MGSYEATKGASALRYIPLSYSPADSQSTALRLILTLFPDWEGAGNKIEFVRFTDGITNTVRAPARLFLNCETLILDLFTDSVIQLLKIINRKAGLTEEQIDNEAVLMRAYGNGTEILIDRESTKPRSICFAPNSFPQPLIPLELFGAPLRLYCRVRHLLK